MFAEVVTCSGVSTRGTLAQTDIPYLATGKPFESSGIESISRITLL